MSQKTRFEVQTRFIYGWENCWSIDDEPDYYDTEQEAEDAINEFFADLGRSGMAQLYDREDYRVRKVFEKGAENG